MIGKNYICEHCGYQKNYSTGFAMIGSDEIIKEEKRLEKEFINEILSGAYGENLKDYFIRNNKIYVDIQEELYQCNECYYLTKHRNKGLFLKTESYEQKTRFIQKCPNCGSERFHKVDHLILCPKCHNEMKLAKIWFE